MSNVANTLVRKSHLSREQLERQLKYQLKVSARLNTRLAQHAIDFKTLNDRCFTLLAERDASEGEAANHRNRVAVVEARLLIAKEALYNLYNACAISDSKEELPSDVDGSFMDAAREALSQLNESDKPEQLWAIILTIERDPVLGEFIASTRKPIRVSSNDVLRAHQALEIQIGKVVIGTKEMLLAHAFDLCEEDFQDEPSRWTDGESEEKKC